MIHPEASRRRSSLSLLSVDESMSVCTDRQSINASGGGATLSGGTFTAIAGCPVADAMAIDPMAVNTMARSRVAIAKEAILVCA